MDASDRSKGLRRSPTTRMWWAPLQKLSIGMLVLTLGSACTELRVTGSDGTDKETTLARSGAGNGNGTGYGGKPTYYWIDSRESCRAKDGSQSNVKGMMTVGDNQAFTYYDGCIQENGVAVPSQEVVFSAQNPDALYFRRTGSLFERRNEFPAGPDGAKQLVANCDFLPPPIPLSGTISYFSRINVTVHRLNGTNPIYTMSVRYEQVDLDMLLRPVRVVQGAESVIEASRSVWDSGDKKAYHSLDGPERELKSYYEGAEFEDGMFSWFILGQERWFPNGECFHERPVPL